jgi:hypothetical protein
LTRSDHSWPTAAESKSKSSSEEGKPKTGGRKGLVSTLGASDGPFFLPNVPGLYKGDVATPVGEKGDPVDLERAEKLDADPGVDLKLVDIPANQVAEAEQRYKEEVEAHTQGAVALRKSRSEREQAHAKAALEATNPAAFGSGNKED